MAKIPSLKPRIGLLGTGRPTLAGTERMTGDRLQKRNRRLQQDRPLCVICQEQGRVTAVAHWDHIIPLHMGGADDESNLQGLCLDCHDAKSSRETAERAVGGMH